MHDTPSRISMGRKKRTRVGDFVTNIGLRREAGTRSGGASDRTGENVYLGKGI
jgi:hypothetical protein